MASLSCSFVTFSKSTCDRSLRYPGVTEFFPLTSCKKDIRSHLRMVKVSQTNILTEKDLILARSAHFDEDGDTMTICPRHRAELGMFWRPRKQCVHPLHGDRKGKPERGANLQMSKEIMAKWSAFIPVGAGNVFYVLRPWSKKNAEYANKRGTVFPRIIARVDLYF